MNKRIEKKQKKERDLTIASDNAKKESSRKYHEESKRKHLLTYGFPITGPETFKKAVRNILQELKNKAPHRYEEAVLLLPKAEYVYGDRGFSGRSDGLFTMDGSHYEAFRWVFLHEVGHNVAYKESNDHSEKAANNYVNMVLRELGL